MPFGYSVKSFPYPAVEYIPLLPIKSYTLNGDTKKHPYFALFTHFNSQIIKPIINQLEDFSLEPATELGIIIFNSQLEMIKYRGNYVTIAITPQLGQDQVITILKKYFYKAHLIFKLIEPHSGEIFCHQKLILPNIR